jgi:hypothetical protein
MNDLSVMRFDPFQSGDGRPTTDKRYIISFLRKSRSLSTGLEPQHAAASTNVLA